MDDDELAGTRYYIGKVENNPATLTSKTDIAQQVLAGINSSSLHECRIA